jgi:cytochrome o ubiquinol oxidase subunit 2
MKTASFPFFHPQGIIALKEFNLFTTALGILGVVVVAVFTIAFIIVWKYRATKNAGAGEAMDVKHSKVVQTFLWAVPILVIASLAVMIWKSTHDLDPYKPIDPSVQPLVIQVVALDWKWLFIYPAQNIATVNFVEFPANTPIQFELTADDAPMNTFLIPQLGGQMYAMAGMETQLHLMAYGIGKYSGSSSEIDGQGYAGMRFIADSVSQSDFDTWVQSVKSLPYVLNASTYKALVVHSVNNPVALYASVDGSLYNQIMMQYMMPDMTITDTPEPIVSTSSMPMMTSTSTAATTTDSGSMNSMMNMPGMHM